MGGRGGGLLGADYRGGGGGGGGELALCTVCNAYDPHPGPFPHIYIYPDFPVFRPGRKGGGESTFLS